jgi:hypothetical protein
MSLTILASSLILTISLFGRTITLPEEVFLPTKEFHSSFPYITGETFRSLSQHVFDDYLEYFFHVIHPQIQHPYILITHHFFGESDSSIPGDQLAPFLDEPRLISWFGINIDRIHPKLLPLPIGVSTPTYHFGNVKVLDKCYASRNEIPKKSLLYMNFAIHTYRQERQYVYDLFKNRPYCTTVGYNRNIPYPKTHQEFLIDLASHKFVLSPRGNGMDCHRTWEALLMGSYPIVKSSFLDPLFKDLPVVIVKQWNEITEDFLNAKFAEFQAISFNYNKLFMSYWMNKIQEVRAEFLQQNKTP